VTRSGIALPGRLIPVLGVDFVVGSDTAEGAAIQPGGAIISTVAGGAR